MSIFLRQPHTYSRANLLKSKAHKFGSLAVRTPLVVAGQRIGIMGGSFNPPHLGHLIVAHTALRRLKLDQLWWVVTPGNPLKSHDGLPPQSERIALCLNLATDPKMKVTGYEAGLGSPYTAVTVGYLVHRYPGAHFVWVMGADNLAGFHRWQDWEGIARSMPFAVVDRPRWRLKAMASPAAHALCNRRIPERLGASIIGSKLPRWTFLTSRLSDLSSTALRRNASR